MNVRIEAVEGAMGKVFVDDVEMMGIKKYHLAQGMDEVPTLEVEMDAANAAAFVAMPGITIIVKEVGRKK